MIGTGHPDISITKEHNLIKLFHAVESSSNLFVYIKKGSAFLGTAKNGSITDSTLLGQLDLKGFVASEKTYQESMRTRRPVDSLKFIIKISKEKVHFHVAERLIANRFLPALNKAVIDHYTEPSKTIVRVKEYGKVACLDRTVDSFLTRKKANIICGKFIVAEVVVDIVTIGSSTVPEDFFERSEEYPTVMKDNHKVQDALVILLRKAVHKVLTKVKY